jgi:hypothetical protein
MVADRNIEGGSKLDADNPAYGVRPYGWTD